ncbi:extracellular solute-binding protein [Bacillus sp. FJAT-50079]|uniref:ABC transporter substrate-binding protein n=1 Tax=Bacillus sp. FJAT-50079 TaxID=2833577 RepID=UPI001BC9BCD5|nr:extracellular solute-binding protein [Bacillus sp. FJAT-50079]MBS4209431.1 extracellular solute-binding protein [Bacillus sp. FJAT-50079]
MKKYLLLILTVVFAVVLAACSGGTEQGSSSTNDTGNEQEKENKEEQPVKEEPEQVTLRMSWWGSQGRHDMTLKIIELYEEQNPHVKIEPEFTGFDGYFERMAAQAAGNNLPDIMQQNFGEYLNLYASQGLLADLNPFVKDGTLNLDGVSETVMDSGIKDDKLLGIPTGTNALTALYDPAMMEEAGVEMKHDWTWEDYENVVTAVKDKTGNFGARLPEPKNIFEYYLREQGYRLFNDDGTGLGYDDDQLLIDYFKLNLKLYEAGSLPGYDVIQQVQGPEDELIVHGKAAIDWRWSNQVGVVTTASGRELELNLLPGANNTKGMYLKPAMFWSIAENSTKKEEAAKFIDFFTNNIEVYNIGGTDRGIPIKEEIRNAMSANLGDVDKKVFEYIEYVTENSTPIDSNFPPEASEVLTELANVDEMVMYKKLSPEEGAAEFRKEAETILNRKK